MQQLALDLQHRRRPARQLPAIERLRAVLTRQGINWHYRQSGGSVLLRPLLGSRFGWQPMCGFYGCGNIVFERVDRYCNRPPLTGDDRQAHAEWLTSKRSQVHELWGRP